MAISSAGKELLSALAVRYVSMHDHMLQAVIRYSYVLVMLSSKHEWVRLY